MRYPRASIHHRFQPVWPVVFYLSPTNRPGQPKTSYQRSVLGRELCRVEFSEVLLYDREATEALRTGPPLLWALLPLLRRAGPVQLESASRKLEVLDRPLEVKRNHQAVLAL